jgi:putative (di)nucleoside polyphosphate hydrolase
MNYRIGVSAFIINENKEFLLVLATKEDPLEPDLWKIPAGGVEENEDSITALKRELNEELGIDPNSLEIVGKSKYIDKYNWPKETSEKKYKKTNIWYDGQEKEIFLTKIITKNYNFKLQLEEICDVRWVNKEDFKYLLLFKDQEEIMQKIIEEFKDFF